MNKVNVLIIEDNAIAALDIESAISTLNNVTSCEIASTFDEAVAKYQSFQPDLILADINLEDTKTGIDFVLHIQQNSSSIPIIYLTAYFDDDTLEKAALTNPSSYIVKPFKREDLLSAISLALYKTRMNNTFLNSEDYLHLGEHYYFDTNLKLLYFKDHQVNLGVKESKLLSILVESKNKLVSFDEIEARIWYDKPAASSSMRTLVYRLRLKIGSNIIETIPTQGLRWKGTY
jgi:DNA-binding response OmpR family regulator